MAESKKRQDGLCTKAMVWQRAEGFKKNGRFATSHLDSIVGIHDGNIPKVNVVMSIYSGQKYLLDMFDSISNQSFTDCECLVSNDDST